MVLKLGNIKRKSSENKNPRVRPGRCLVRPLPARCGCSAGAFCAGPCLVPQAAEAPFPRCGWRRGRGLHQASGYSGPFPGWKAGSVRSRSVLLRGLSAAAGQGGSSWSSGGGQAPGQKQMRSICGLERAVPGFCREQSQQGQAGCARVGRGAGGLGWQVERPVGWWHNASSGGAAGCHLE